MEDVLGIQLLMLKIMKNRENKAWNYKYNCSYQWKFASKNFDRAMIITEAKTAKNTGIVEGSKYSNGIATDLEQME